jgi:hypothetical protein
MKYTYKEEEKTLETHSHTHSHTHTAIQPYIQSYSHKNPQEESGSLPLRCGDDLVENQLLVHVRAHLQALLDIEIDT